MIICLLVFTEEQEIVIIINFLSFIVGQISLKICFGTIYRHKSVKSFKYFKPALANEEHVFSTEDVILLPKLLSTETSASYTSHQTKLKNVTFTCVKTWSWSFVLCIKDTIGITYSPSFFKHQATRLRRPFEWFMLLPGYTPPELSCSPDLIHSTKLSKLHFDKVTNSELFSIITAYH